MADPRAACRMSGLLYSISDLVIPYTRKGPKYQHMGYMYTYICMYIWFLHQIYGLYTRNGKNGVGNILCIWVLGPLGIWEFIRPLQYVNHKLLGGSWDSVTTWNWACNPTYEWAKPCKAS